jgi:hypothetical protein
MEETRRRQQVTAFPRVTEVVKAVLKNQKRLGTTTKTAATTMTWQKIKDTGGPTKYGIGAAAMHIGCLHVIEGEVTRQLKTQLSDHEIEYILPKKMPEELKDILGKFPRWFAIEEGPDALWVHWEKATRDHWIANAQLKQKKAEQTRNAARAILDIVEWLELHGLRSLGDVFREK